MEKEYLIVALISLVASFVLQIMENSLSWLVLGFGSVMLLFGLFCKRKNELVEDEVKNLNLKEGIKNDV